MNEPVDIPLSLTESTPFKVSSVYREDGQIIPVEWNSMILASFPWLIFLGEATELTVGSETYVFGLVDNIERSDVPVTVSDALGFYMIDESIRPLFGKEYEYVDWNKLPPTLSWLYGDKPYITSKDLTPILAELRDAIKTGTVSDDLYRYLETRTYDAPKQTESYLSYGLYFENDMLVPHGLPSKVDMRLGFYNYKGKEQLDFIEYDNTIELDNDEARIIEIVIQQRLGDAVSAQVLIIDSPLFIPKYINLTTSEVGEQLWRSLSDYKTFQLSLTLLYNVSKQLPLYAETDTITTNRHIPLRTLSSEEGYIGSPSLELRTISKVIPSGVEVPNITADALLFDDNMISIDHLDDATLYAEYQIA